MIQTAVICYHKNINKIYPSKWIGEYKNSIIKQTHLAFDLYELNYGGGEERVFENSNYESKEFPSFVYGLNYLLESLRNDYDCVMNTNVDDVYALDRFEKQLPYIERGYDIVSSNFSLVEDDKVIKTHAFDKLDIALELSNNHNVVCHPTVCYSKNFLMNNRYIPEQQPLEDMMLWQRTVKKFKYIILPDVLCYHRLHEQSVCQNEENR